MKNPKLFLISGLLFLQVAVSITLATSVTYDMDYAKAPEGFQVWGIDLSGRTNDEAYQCLEREIPREVFYQDSTYPLTITQSQKNLQSWLNTQLIPESDSWWMNAVNHLKRMGPAQLSPELLDENEIYPQLENIAQQINKEGKPASMQLHNGKFAVQSGSPSVVMDIPASWEYLNESRGLNSVPLVVNSQELAPTESDLRKIKDVIGDYTTYFDPINTARTNNVRLAANAIDGKLIEPGGEFSFNQVVGKRDKEKGYLPAYTFVDQNVVLDDGGGICQDSSTLYHAVNQAQLQVVERNTHSLPVTYVPKGQDATVAYGLLDFRFRNTTQGYIYINARTGNNWIRIRIYGVADEHHPVLAEPDGYPIKPDPNMK